MNGYKSWFEISNSNHKILNYKHMRANTKSFFINRNDLNERKEITERRLINNMPLIYRYSVKTKKIALPPILKSTCNINNCNK